jgi:dephospho-CoA kinase
MEPGMGGRSLKVSPGGRASGGDTYFSGRSFPWAMRVVATTGMPGAGKGLGVEVAEQLGVEVVAMGDLVREVTRERGLDPGPEAFGRVATEVRQEEGPDAWARRTVERVREVGESPVLVDGMRSLDELDVFREAFDDVLTVALLASPETRYERMRERGRSEDAEDEAALRERDRRELGHGLGEAIAMADIYIVNEETPEQAKATLRAVLGAGER